MNKTLLLIICDFLLISILALVEFDPQESLENPAAQIEQNAQQGAEADLVEVLRLSLEDEARNRETLSEQLSERERALQEQEAQLEATQAELAEREEVLELTAAEKERLAALQEELEAQKQNLEQSYAEARTELERTASERETLAQELASRSDRNRALQEELQRRQQALAEAEKTVEELAREREELARQRQELEMDLRITETERRMLEQNLVAAQAEREKAEVEKSRAEEQATRLAQGVTQLAESSEQLKEEFRQAQPKSLNAIFTDFRENRVDVNLTYSTAGLFGARDRTETIQTILVEDAGDVYALFGAADTPLAPESLNWLDSMRATLRLAGNQLEVVELAYLRDDPRVVAFRVPRAFVNGTGLKVFRLDPDPLRFPEAVVIANKTGYYGESTFKVDARNTNYLEMQSRLFNRLFGEFSPSRGDFVFSKSGEVLGIMVSDGRALQLDDILPADRLRIGSGFSDDAADQLGARLQRRQP